MRVINQVTLALVVDDDPITSAIVCRALRTAGYRVKTADRISQALALLENEAPDVMFSEMTLADGSGIALVFECRVLQPTLRFVLMARQPSAEISIEAMRNGVSDILLKPVTGFAVAAALVRMPKVGWRYESPAQVVAAVVIEPSEDSVSVAFGGGLKQIKKTVVLAALRRYDGNKSATARALGIPRRSLYRLLSAESRSPDGQRRAAR